jgi:hypothetical protein
LKKKRIFNVKYIFLIALTISANLMVFELVASNYFKKYNLEKKSKLQEKSVFFDRRSRFQYIKDEYSEKGKILYPSISPGYLMRRIVIKDFLPLSDISRKNLLYCNESGKYVEYLSNDYGFRSNFSTKQLKNRRTNERNEYKSKNLKQAFWLLGDSFVQGGCVSKESTFENTIIKKFPNSEVFSFGRGGTSIGIQLAIFKEYIVDSLSQNDIVFIFHYPANDFYEVKAESKNKIINSYFYLDGFSQNLISLEGNKRKDEFMLSYTNNYISDVDTKEKNKIPLTEFLKFKNTIKLLSNNQLLRSIFLKDNPPQSEKIYFEYLKKIAKEILKRNAKLVVACIPNSFDLLNNEKQSKCSKSNELLIEYSLNQNLNITFINVEDKLLNSPIKDLYPNGDYDLHFSEYGYKFYMQKVLEKLLS